MLPTGIGTTTPHLTWNSEPFKQGEGTILELAGCRMRYHCPMSRTVYLGKPPERMADVAKVCVEALNVAIEAASPGTTCEAVHAAWNSVVSRHGFSKKLKHCVIHDLKLPRTGPLMELVLVAAQGLNFEADAERKTARIKIASINAVAIPNSAKRHKINMQ